MAIPTRRGMLYGISGGVKRPNMSENKMHFTSPKIFARAKKTLHRQWRSCRKSSHRFDETPYFAVLGLTNTLKKFSNLSMTYFKQKLKNSRKQLILSPCIDREYTNTPFRGY